MIYKHRGIIFLLICAVLLRIGVIGYALQFRENTDILRWKDRVRISYLYSFADTYKTDYLQFGTYPNNMPPLGHYINYGVYQTWLQIGKMLAHLGVPPGSNDWVNGPFLTLLLRIPQLIAQLGIAAIIYSMVLGATRSQKKALVSSSLFLFNPVVLFNGDFMGQRDSINNVFFLLGTYMFIKKRYGLAAAFVACSFLVKFSLIFTIPILFYFLYVSTKSLRSIIVTIGVAIFVTLVGVLPVSATPISWYLEFFIKNVSGEMANLSAFAFNAWWVIFRPVVTFGSNSDPFTASDIRLHGTPFSYDLWFGIPVGVWATAVFILFCIPLIIHIIRLGKNAITSKYMALSLGLVCLIAFMWLPKMHDRYMYPMFPFLAIAIGTGAPFLREYVALAVLNTINLIVVWHPMPLNDFWYTLLGDQNFQWGTSIVTLVVSCILYIRALRFFSK